MAFWILQTVLFAVRIEVAARGLEVGTVALGILMNMDGVLSRRQILQVELDLDTFLARRGHRRGTRVLSLSVLQLNSSTFTFALRLGRRGKREYPKNHSNNYEPSFHLFSFCGNSTMTNRRDKEARGAEVERTQAFLVFAASRCLRSLKLF